MSGIPVVIDEKNGFPVKPVADEAPLMTVSENGRGFPIKIDEVRGAPFVVQGLEPAGDVAPYNITPPTISPMSPQVGDTITANPGTYGGQPNPTVISQVQAQYENGGGADVPDPLIAEVGVRYRVLSLGQSSLGATPIYYSEWTNYTSVEEITAYNITPPEMGVPVVSQQISSNSLGTWGGTPIPELQTAQFEKQLGTTGAIEPAGTPQDPESAAYGYRYRLTATFANRAGSATASSEWSEVLEAPIDSVVIIGASHENAMFGKNLTTPHSASTNLLKSLGHNLPVYGYATGGARLLVADDHYSAARAAHPNALIIAQFGGNNVSDSRPYPGGVDLFNAGLADLLALAKDDTRFYHASMTFRDYDDTTFQNPQNGSKPYNENLLIPWIAANFPQAIGAAGRPKLDYYRYVLKDFENLLEADNIHFTTAGYANFRTWIINRVADILNGVTPAEIPERVYVPPVESAQQAPSVTSQPTISGETTVGATLTATAGTASGTPAPTATYQWYLDGAIQTGQTGVNFTRPAAVGAVPSVTVTWSNGVNPAASASVNAPASTAAASTPTVYPLSIINFTGSAYATGRVPTNEVFGNEATVNANPLANIVDVDGNPTGMSLAHSYTGNPVVGTTAPGRGSHNAGNYTTFGAYNKQLMAGEIVRAGAYVTSGVTMVLSLSGMVPGASYEFGFVASRNAADVRNTILTIGGVATTWNTSEATPIERKVTVPAGSDGKLSVVLAPQAGTTFAYLNGLSIQRM